MFILNLFAVLCGFTGSLYKYVAEDYTDIQVEDAVYSRSSYRNGNLGLFLLQVLF